MFGTSSAFGSRPNSIFSPSTANTSQNPLNDIEVSCGTPYFPDEVCINLIIYGCLNTDFEKRK